MAQNFQQQRGFLAALLVVALLGIAMPAGASSGGGGAGGSGGEGGERIGVAQEAESGCCCTVPVVEGSGSKCYTVTGTTECDPYTFYSPGACSATGPSTGVGGCSVSGVRSGAGGADVVEVFVILLALVLGARHCRFKWRAGPRRSGRGVRFQHDC